MTVPIIPVPVTVRQEPLVNAELNLDGMPDDQRTAEMARHIAAENDRRIMEGMRVREDLVTYGTAYTDGEGNRVDPANVVQYTDGARTIDGEELNIHRANTPPPQTYGIPITQWNVNLDNMNDLWFRNQVMGEFPVRREDMVNDTPPRPGRINQDEFFNRGEAAVSVVDGSGYPDPRTHEVQESFGTHVVKLADAAFRMSRLAHVQYSREIYSSIQHALECRSITITLPRMSGTSTMIFERIIPYFSEFTKVYASFQTLEMLKRAKRRYEGSEEYLRSMNDIINGHEHYSRDDILIFDGWRHLGKTQRDGLLAHFPGFFILMG